MINRIARCSKFVSAFSFMLMASRAFAADAVLEEIVVTAQKREQNMQSVGVSVAAFSNEQLKSLGFTNTVDVTQHTPGLSVGVVGGTGAINLLSIRGVAQNDYNLHQESPNAIYVDQAYLSFLGAASGQMFDLERVEVLRGPQGTLFGRNATGGLLHYVSRKPSGDLNGYTQLRIAEFNQVRFEGAIGGGFSDTVSGRIAVMTNNHDGITENRAGPDAHEADSRAVRAHLKVEPGDTFDALISAHYSVNDNEKAAVYQHVAAGIDANGLGYDLADDENFWGTCNGCDFLGYRDADNDMHAGAWDRVGFMDRRVAGATATLNWRLGDLNVTAVSNYTDIDIYYGEESDSSTNALLTVDIDQGARQFSQELRISSETGRANWVAGLYYLDVDSSMFQMLDVPIFSGTPFGYRSLSFADSKTRSWAMFGHVEFDMADEWKLTAGVRWTDDDKKHENFVDEVDVGYGRVLDFTRATVGDLTHYSEGDWAGKLALDWTPSDNMLIYGSITRGHKSGGFNASIDGAIPVSEMRFEAEILTSYELGLKATLFGGNTRLNSSAFYYDYKDYQAFDLRGLAAVISNRDAKVSGAEIELTTVPAEGWLLNLGASFLDTTVKDFGLSTGLLVDRKAPMSPEFSLNGLLRKEWQLSSGRIGVQVDVSHVGKQYFAGSNAPTSLASAYTTVGARLAFASDKNWEVAVFGQNLTDEDYVVYVYDISAFGYNLKSYGPPRWAGVEFRYDFGS